MNLTGILVVLAGPLLAVVWIVSEFKAGRSLRLTLGLLAVIIMIVVTWFATLVINQLNYNSSYGFATKELIDQTITGIESNNTAAVLSELKRFQADYHPTYENRANYVPLVEQTVERMKSSNPR
jgi:hypothetical protein